MWSFFQRRICLTNDDAEWSLAQAEFARVGLTVDKFQAVREIGPHQSFSHSERNILLDFLYSDADTLLHLEDDCVFRDLSHLPQALNELPSNWDIVYLGANVLDETPQRISPHLCRIKNAWTTHAVGYNKKVVRFLLENQPEFSKVMFDNFLGSVLGSLNAFVVSPMVAYQRPRESSIWGRYDDYTPLFEDCDKRLRKAPVIYRITSPSGRVYIGQTRRFPTRMSTYRTLKCTSQKRLYNSLKKYGFENHVTTILHKLPFYASQEMVDAYEKDAIRVHAGVNGARLLNSTSGGRGNGYGWKAKTEKHVTLRGERHALSKLTEEEVVDIRLFYRKGVRGRGIRQIAQIWKISMRLAYNIVQNKTWKHVAVPS